MRVLTCAPPEAGASEVRIGAGAADAAVLGALEQPFVLADGVIPELYPELAEVAPHLVLRGGEEIKSLATLEKVLRHMAGLGLDRRARLIALGGGTIGDLGGLAAALYLRGIALVQVPTTLLAMLDSAVGGKTAVNLPEGKNLVGQVWPAELVLIDPRFLSSLPESELASGLGEALKMAIGLDAELFALLEAHTLASLRADMQAMEQVIALAVRAKIRIVEEDQRESGPRRLLNLGHTLGHALEAHSGGGVAHGLCVARGLYFALELAAELEVIEPAHAERCRALLAAHGFEPHALPPRDELRPFLARDKKTEGGAIHFVLPAGIGESRVEPLSLDRVCALLD